MTKLALTNEQYEQIIDVVWDRHRFGGLSDSPDKKHIKYVRPNWDMRDGMCFSIKFDGMFGTITFNSGYPETEPMYDRIMRWLEDSRE